MRVTDEQLYNSTFILCGVTPEEVSTMLNEYHERFEKEITEEEDRNRSIRKLWYDNDD